MARNLSLDARRAIYAPETDACFIILLTLSHLDLSPPIRVSSDAVNTVSRGLNFLAMPFDLSLPTDEDEGIPRAQLTIDNVHRDIVRAVRSIASPPAVLMEIVTASMPDLVEASFPDFRFESVSYNALTVSGSLSLEAFLSEPYPAAAMTPQLFPALL